MALDKKSMINHNNVKGGYKDLTVDVVRKQNEQCTKNSIQYDDDKPLGKMLDAHPEIQVCIDIGCGLGWAADFMAQTRKKVYAIEPSKQALDIAGKLYSHNKNITWMPDFAEDALTMIRFMEDEPLFFNTLCVLSHLEDVAVLAICAEIDKAPQGSALAFSELWGTESHEPLWHTRTKEWWKNALPSFKLEFIERPCQKPGRFKSFTGIK